MTRLAYLGPPGTFSEEALRASPHAEGAELLPYPTIRETIMAVHDGRADLALAPIENVLEGSVTATLDTLVVDAPGVAIVGEVVRTIRNCLIAREALAEEAIEVVVSHPQPVGQCGIFLREHLPQASVRMASSTAEAVRTVGQTDAPWAALGPLTAAEVYGCRVLAEGIDDDPDNVTRFVWLGPTGTEPLEASASAGWKTSVVFTGPGDSTPGWLVRCLSEFAFRGVNLTKIESRPHRARRGSYVFHVDVEGRADEGQIADALAGLGTHCELVRTLGSYPTA